MATLAPLCRFLFL